MLFSHRQVKPGCVLNSQHGLMATGLLDFFQRSGQVGICQFGIGFLRLPHHIIM